MLKRKRIARGWHGAFRGIVKAGRGSGLEVSPTQGKPFKETPPHPDQSLCPYNFGMALISLS